MMKLLFTLALLAAASAAATTTAAAAAATTTAAAADATTTTAAGAAVTTTAAAAAEPLFCLTSAGSVDCSATVPSTETPVCMVFNFLCNEHDTMCSDEQNAAGAIVAVQLCNTADIAPQIAQLPDIFRDFCVCTTNDCNVAPGACVGGATTAPGATTTTASGATTTAASGSTTTAASGSTTTAASGTTTTAPSGNFTTSGNATTTAAPLPLSCLSQLPGSNLTVDDECTGLVCVAYNIVCQAGDAFCTANETSSGAVKASLSCVDEEVALQLASAPEMFLDFCSCTTNNCNVAPGACAASVTTSSNSTDNVVTEVPPTTAPTASGVKVAASLLVVLATLLF